MIFSYEILTWILTKKQRKNCFETWKPEPQECTHRVRSTEHGLASPILLTSLEVHLLPTEEVKYFTFLWKLGAGRKKATTLLYCHYYLLKRLHSNIFLRFPIFNFLSCSSSCAQFCNTIQHYLRIFPSNMIGKSSK